MLTNCIHKSSFCAVEYWMYDYCIESSLFRIEVQYDKSPFSGIGVSIVILWDENPECK